MGMKDVIKSSIYERFAGGSELSFWSVCLILVMACVIGLFIYVVYKNFCKSEFYSKDLNITMAGMTIVVAAIMIAMQSNLIVSLGMIGALSIVRFRTAVKNPIDLLYLFWSISAGIICGVGLYVLALALCAIMTILLYALGLVPNNKAPSLLVLRTDLDVDVFEVKKEIYKETKYLKQKSVIIKNNYKECIFEIETDKSEEIVKRLQNFKGIESINLIEYEGEYRG